MFVISVFCSKISWYNYLVQVSLHFQKFPPLTSMHFPTSLRRVDCLYSIIVKQPNLGNRSQHDTYPYTAEIILIPKPGKDPKELTSYPPITLLPTVNKIFQKLLLWRINTDLKPDDWMPPHQFGFRNQHSTLQQTHRINLHSTLQQTHRINL
jgi:hypothetical protein